MLVGDPKHGLGWQELVDISQGSHCGPLGPCGAMFLGGAPGHM